MSTSLSNWSITPIELARRMAHVSWFNYLSTDSGLLEILYRVWLLRCGNQLVLVDTGPDPLEGQRRGLVEIKPLSKGLQEVGVEPADIRDVLLTHLHWDHASSLEQLPCATFWAQPQELDFFQHQAWKDPSTARFFSHRAALERALQNGRLRPLNEQGPRWDGLEPVRVGGHTPGSQLLKISTNNGLAVLSGDVIPMNANYTQNLPTGILVDLLEVLQAKRLVRAWNPKRLYTGHDPQPFLDCVDMSHG